MDILWDILAASSDETATSSNLISPIGTYTSHQARIQKSWEITPLSSHWCFTFGISFSQRYCENNCTTLAWVRLGISGNLFGANTVPSGRRGTIFEKNVRNVSIRRSTLFVYLFVVSNSVCRASITLSKSLYVSVSRNSKVGVVLSQISVQLDVFMEFLKKRFYIKNIFCQTNVNKYYTIDMNHNSLIFCFFHSFLYNFPVYFGILFSH